ncbi:MAG: acylphosphatase [Gammaproteobacteria bacterium]|nr:acylphosphatase [Gammaproteobacteria bacterium]
MKAARFIVRGKVQGVWFRAATREQALELGLRGEARNLSDGSVRVLACGDDDAVARLQAWLTVGPPLARVSELVREDVDPGAVPSGFEIL